MALKPDKYTTLCPFLSLPTYKKKIITFLPSKVAYRYPIQYNLLGFYITKL